MFRNGWDNIKSADAISAIESDSLLNLITISGDRMLLRMILLVTALVCALDAQTPSDWLYLRSGAKIQGTFIAGDSQKIRFRSADRSITDYNRADVTWSKLRSSTDASSSSTQSGASNPTASRQPGSLPGCMKASPPDVPANPGSSVPVDQARLALQFHNCARREVGTPPLVWSPDLAAHAQNWANHLASQENCNLVHTTNNPYGQNLFGGTGRNWTALDASQSWYSEKNNYHYAAINQNNWYPTGHYTQMIWKNTRSVGMGQATCRGGTIVIVAEYDPRGNYLGEAPY